MGLKKDEFICNCSDIDDVIIFYRNGTYKIVKVADKIFIGKDILYVKRILSVNDNRTILQRHIPGTVSSDIITSNASPSQALHAIGNTT